MQRVQAHNALHYPTLEWSSHDVYLANHLIAWPLPHPQSPAPTALAPAEGAWLRNHVEELQRMPPQVFARPPKSSD
eukprot:6305731-Karenia_brevis.AAC.1